MKQEPLTESYFYILLCLHAGPNHGYGIMQKTMELSEGHVRIGSGTMYGAVSNMMGKGWIRECPGADASLLNRRRQYELTEAGRNVLMAEIDRLHHLARVADMVMAKVPQKALWALHAQENSPKTPVRDSCPTPDTVLSTDNERRGHVCEN